ncbi:MAG: AzlC family ABC transporter permease [Erysipelotrichaceae bacterium]|nr:AzlC family ABC transporter permease [Erysipelotrichaceae bacterium]
MQKETREAFKDSLVILPGYLVLGMGFGILMDSKGFSVLHTLAMSVFIYAGSMQYAGVDLLTGYASLITTFLMTVMVNIRHLFYGIGILKEYSALKKHRLYDIFALTDETFSIVCSKSLSGMNKGNYCFYLSLFNHLWWITGSLSGAILGDILPFNYTGIDFSMTALFIVIVLNQWETGKDHTAVILSFLISFLCLLLFGKNDFLIWSMVFITIMLFILKRIRRNDNA